MVYFVLQVDNPNRVYKGQILTKEVRIKTPEATRATMPTMPSSTCVRYKMTNRTDTITLSIRSKFPMFFFIVFGFIPQI